MTKLTIKLILLNSILYGLICSTNITFGMESSSDSEDNSLSLKIYLLKEDTQYHQLLPNGSITHDPIYVNNDFKTIKLKNNAQITVKQQHNASLVITNNRCSLDIENKNNNNRNSKHVVNHLIPTTITLSQISSLQASTTRDNDQQPLDFALDKNGIIYFLNTNIKFMDTQSASFIKNKSKSASSSSSDDDAHISSSSELENINIELFKSYTTINDSDVKIYIVGDETAWLITSSGEKPYDPIPCDNSCVGFATIDRTNDQSIILNVSESIGIRLTNENLIKRITGLQENTLLEIVIDDKIDFYRLRTETIKKDLVPSSVNSDSGLNDNPSSVVTIGTKNNNDDIWFPALLYMQDSETKAYHAIGANGVIQKESLMGFKVNKLTNYDILTTTNDEITLQDQDNSENIIRVAVTKEQIETINPFTLDNGLAVIIDKDDNQYNLYKNMIIDASADENAITIYVKNRIEGPISLLKPDGTPLTLEKCDEQYNNLFNGTCKEDDAVIKGRTLRLPTEQIVVNNLDEALIKQINDSQGSLFSIKINDTITLFRLHEEPVICKTTFTASLSRHIDDETEESFDLAGSPTPRSNFRYYVAAAGTFGLGLAGLIIAYFRFPELFKNLPIPNFLRLIPRGN